MTTKISKTYSIEEAAELTPYSKYTIRKFCREGLIGSKPFSRWQLSAFDIRRLQGALK